MFIPGCDRCGQCGCSCGTLPYTLTATFSGLKNRAHSDHCQLVFTSNFGCGAAAVGMLPGGCDDNDPDCGDSDRGPLTSVLLTDGGHDYARTGRKQPTLTITGGTGTGATFTPTLAAIDATLAEQCRSYELASVSVSGGTGYADGEALTIAADGETVTPASAILHAERIQPELTASVAGGAGAEFSVAMSANVGSPATWGVSSVTVDSAGTGYPFTTYSSTLPVVFSTTGVTESGATANAKPVVVEPDIEPAVWTDGGGTGFQATITLSATTDNGDDCFTVSGIAITNAGSGYTVGDLLEIVAQDRDPTNGPTGVVVYTVATVNGTGGVTSVSAPSVNEFFGACPGEIASVTVEAAGFYYSTNGTPANVEVVFPGEYFTEDPNAPICTAKVTINADACGGTGAEISAVIDDDPTSASYGQITGLTIDEQGSDYLCWLWVCDSLSVMNGEPIVLTAVNPRRLVTIRVDACFGAGACVVVIPKGPNIVCDGNTIASAYSGGATPIREIAVWNAGSGYARLGREEPQWTITTSGWTFTPTFGNELADDCGMAYWEVESMAVTSGSGVTLLDGWDLTHSISHPEHSDEHFSAVVHTRVAPTVTATADDSGSGASFTVSVEEIGGQPKQWRVASISGGGGSGYDTETPITFTVEQRTNEFGHYVNVPAFATAIADENGSIIKTVLRSGGIYWRDEGIPQSVEVNRGGRYYRENAALTPYVATVTATVDQLPPSSGSGAAISIAVNDDTSSPGFGAIAATLDSQGSGYTLLSGPLDCEYVSECDTTNVHVGLRGNGNPVDLTITRASGAFIALRTDDALADCDDLPPTASVLYGHPVEATAAIASGGAVETTCDVPLWCSGPCACPTISGDTAIDVSSDFPCNGGTASFNGILGNFALNCSWTDPATNITYESDVVLTFECCPRKCNDDAECVYEMRAILSGILGLPDDALSWQTNKQLEGECNTVTVTDGVVNATLTIPVGPYTFTVVLGAG